MVKTSKELSLTIYLQWPECTTLIKPLIISASLPSLYFELTLPWVVYFISWAIQVIPVWILQFKKLIIFNRFATFKRCQLHCTFVTNTENLSPTTKKRQQHHHHLLWWWPLWSYHQQNTATNIINLWLTLRCQQHDDVSIISVQTVQFPNSWLIFHWCLHFCNPESVMWRIWYAAYHTISINKTRENTLEIDWYTKTTCYETL